LSQLAYLLASIAIMVALSALGLHVAFCILAGLLVLGLLALGPRGLWAALSAGLTDLSIWDITASVALIAVLGSVMRELGQLDEMMDGLRSLGIRGRSLMAVSSALLGLLPVPGGAILSASVVDEERRNLKLGEKGPATANLLFRHLNFFIYPLSPALIFLASPDVLNVSIPVLILALLPASLAHLASSTVSSFYGLRPSGTSPRRPFNTKDLAGLLKGLIPILAAPVLGSLGFWLSPSLCISILLSLLLAKPSKEVLKKVLQGLRKSKAHSFAVPVLLALLFRTVFKASGASGVLRTLLGKMPVPEWLSLCIFAFFLGLATGAVMLPLTAILPADISMIEGVIAYAGAVAGYVISPLHLCFIVTAEYFGLKQAEMYPRLAVYAVLMVGMSLALVLSLSPLY